MVNGYATERKKTKRNLHSVGVADVPGRRWRQRHRAQPSHGADRLEALGSQLRDVLSVSAPPEFLTGAVAAQLAHRDRERECFPSRPRHWWRRYSHLARDERFGDRQADTGTAIAQNHARCRRDRTLRGPAEVFGRDAIAGVGLSRDLI